MYVELHPTMTPPAIGAVIKSRNYSLPYAIRLTPIAAITDEEIEKSVLIPAFV
jgi:hypothetical protein